jgi:hypothetical protein
MKGGRDGYNPGPKPNVYVSNADGKLGQSLGVDSEHDNYKGPQRTDAARGGFAGKLTKKGQQV